MAVALVAGLVIAGPAVAYLDFVPLMATGAWQANAGSYMKNWHRYIEQKKGGAPAAAASTGVVAGETSANVPAQLAAAYPERTRAEAERSFRELLQGYRQIESRFGIPRNDIGGATAAFIAGSWMAYHDRPFPDAHFKTLVGQMRLALGSNESFASAPESEKREMFERLAILGMFMATVQMAQSRTPTPGVADNMRAAGRTSLEQLLQTDAERVVIDANGLSLR